MKNIIINPHPHPNVNCTPKVLCLTFGVQFNEIGKGREVIMIFYKSVTLFFIHLIYKFLIVLCHYRTFQFQGIGQLTTLHTEWFG